VSEAKDRNFVLMTFVARRRVTADKALIRPFDAHVNAVCLHNSRQASGAEKQGDGKHKSGSYDLVKIHNTPLENKKPESFST